MNYQGLYIKCILVYIQRYNFEQIGFEISKKKQTRNTKFTWFWNITIKKYHYGVKRESIWGGESVSANLHTFTGPRRQRIAKDFHSELLSRRNQKKCDKEVIYSHFILSNLPVNISLSYPYNKSLKKSLNNSQLFMCCNHPISASFPWP